MSPATPDSRFFGPGNGSTDQEIVMTNLVQPIDHRSEARHLGITGLLLLVSLALAGCGTAVGAGAGGYLGNRLTHGSAAGTVGGVVAGGLLGHVLTGN
jgi:osmotically inducible lipoprotein OsmB